MVLIKDYLFDSKYLVVILFVQSNWILLDFPNVNVKTLRNVLYILNSYCFSEYLSISFNLGR